MSLILSYLTRLPLQLAVCAIMTAVVGMTLHAPVTLRPDLSSLDRATFVSALGAIATLLALFCSLSIAWILFVSQQSKAERLAAYDILKSRLLEAERWLFALAPSTDRDVCLSLVFALDKLALSDLPQTDRGPEYVAYCNALTSGLDGKDSTRRKFYLISSTHFGYIEELLNRIGVVAIRQIITGLFIETFAKGVVLIWLAVIGLIVAVFFVGDGATMFLALVTTFTAVGSALLLTEVWVDLRRAYGDELDFVASGDASGD